MRDDFEGEGELTGPLGPDGAPADVMASWDQASPDQVPAGPAGLAEVVRQRDEYLDTLRRVQADFDNYRKRVERQQREMADNAATSLVKKLLLVLDTADLAIAHGGGEDVKQVEAALFDILSKEGLERIVPDGQPFDPEVHDAVAHEPAEGAGAPGTARSERSAASRVPLEGPRRAPGHGESQRLTRWRSSANGSRRIITRSWGCRRRLGQRRSPAPTASWPSSTTLMPTLGQRNASRRSRPPTRS